MPREGYNYQEEKVTENMRISFSIEPQHNFHKLEIFNSNKVFQHTSLLSEVSSMG